MVGAHELGAAKATAARSGAVAAHSVAFGGFGFGVDAVRARRFRPRPSERVTGDGRRGWGFWFMLTNPSPPTLAGVGLGLVRRLF